MQGYRKIHTVRGTYYVSWRPEDVSSLIASEQWTPDELFPNNRMQLRRFLRELYLLACKASLKANPGNNHFIHRVLLHYARDVHDYSRRTTHMGCPCAH